MNVLSLFSGVGGFDLGLENAGMKTIYQCEWDKHATRILERHWPTVPRWGDISTLTAKEILSHGTPPDVVAWGSPCQDLSVAGKRAGLEGERSGLFHEGIRIINELRKETNNEYPRISIWENVAGALSSNRGADFGVIIDEMAKAGAMVIEWGLLDAQHFGIPQRRRRVFVIAVFNSATATNCPIPLLPVGESLRGDSKKGKPKRKSATSETSESLGAGSRSEQFLTEESYAESSFAQFKEGDVAALKASGGVLGGGSETLIVGALTVSDLTRQVTNEIVSKNLLQVVEPYLSFDTQFGSNANVFEDQSPTLKASQAAPSVAYGIQGNVIGRQPQNGPAGKGHTEEGDPMFTLTGTDIHAVATPMAVRRLTPLECERLMGWPDDHTRYKADGTEQADTHRYKQCGNGVASPVAEWIGKQLMKLDEVAS
jgi:DNA (cytosine-5)-methyltransferase 1